MKILSALWGQAERHLLWFPLKNNKFLMHLIKFFINRCKSRDKRLNWFSSPVDQIIDYYYWSDCIIVDWLVASGLDSCLWHRFFHSKNKWLIHIQRILHSARSFVLVAMAFCADRLNTFVIDTCTISLFFIQ